MSGNSVPDEPCIHFSYFHDQRELPGPKELLDGGNADSLLVRFVITKLYEVRGRCTTLFEGWRIHLYSVSDLNDLMANHACALAAFIANSFGATDEQYREITRITSDRQIRNAAPEVQALLQKIRSAFHEICLPIVGVINVERVQDVSSQTRYKIGIIVQITHTLVDFVNGKTWLLDLDFLRKEILEELQRQGLDIMEMTITQSK